MATSCAEEEDPTVSSFLVIILLILIAPWVGIGMYKDKVVFVGINALS